ncbi:response regulator [Devosia sp.]|uniref:response regulator n=1 Tax=Devosia sp. TaxID=1871048 RepID=UPI002F1030E7
MTGTTSGVPAMRVLILEDEVLLALEAAETLEEIGAVVIGPAYRIDTAMALLDAERPDAALLDVNINGATSAKVAQRLRDENIPFVLATGYANQSGISGEAAIIDKPYDRAQLQAAFLRLGAAATPGLPTSPARPA